MQKSFAERVRDEAIKYSCKYQSVFVDYEFILFSKAFQSQQYYILNFQPQNYLHLIGVNSLIPPNDFFNKCYNQSLTLNDFDFNKGNNPKSTIGSVRRKINALDGLMNLFSHPLYAQEGFKKNNVACAIATTDSASYTLGLASNKKHKNIVYPMSLMKGNQIDKTKQENVELVLRKPLGQCEFDEIIIGDYMMLNLYIDNIPSIPISSSLLRRK